jgi:DNA-binding transcriptional regulator YiaG/predicted nucleotidyltransferase
MKAEITGKFNASLGEDGPISPGDVTASRNFEVKPVDVIQIRKSYRLTQAEFAAMLRVSLRTLQNWEQGRRVPEGPAQVLLQMAARYPEMFWKQSRSAKMTQAEILQKCKLILESNYKSQFKGLILYGSTARNQSSSASDIDLLVLLGQPFDYFRELRRIVEMLYPLQLESDQLISAKPASLDDFERGAIQLYRNAKREGVLV